MKKLFYFGLLIIVFFFTSCADKKKIHEYLNSCLGSAQSNYLNYQDKSHNLDVAQSTAKEIIETAECVEKNANECGCEFCNTAKKSAEMSKFHANLSLKSNSSKEANENVKKAFSYLSVDVP